MIKINLAPIEELESPYWWVPDILAFALILGISLVGVDYYLDITRLEIERLNVEIESLNQNYRDLQQDVDRYNGLQKNITQLKAMRNSLQKITESKLTRYTPVILLEHVQNLKPEGVWLTQINFGGAQDDGGDDRKVDGKNAITLNGNAMNNIVLAEFLTLLKSTKNQDVDAGDLRSQVYFDEVILYTATRVSFQLGAGDDPEAGNDDKGVPVMSFQIGLVYKERSGHLGNISSLDVSRMGRRL